MIYNLSEAVFENDFYALETAKGDTIILNLVDEQIAHNGEELNVNAINLAVVDSEDNYHDGVNVIGDSNEFYAIKSDYTQYLGQPLNKDNVQYCTLEVYDD
jgi:hypothetical protein